MKKVCGIRYKLIKALANRMYGLESRRINKEDIIFASRERALIDVFDFYDVKKGFNILAAQLSKIDVAILVDYVAQYPVQLIRRRMGYFLERLGVSRKLLSKIDTGIKGYSFLYDTDIKKGKADKRWRVIVNG